MLLMAATPPEPDPSTSTRTYDLWPSIETPPRGNTHAFDDVAVVIGVEQYTNLPQALYAVKDARLFATWLQLGRGVPTSRVTRLEEPSADEITRAVAAAARAARPGGTLWLYFAGHGLVSGSDGLHHLLPVDGTLDGAGVPLDALVATAAGSGAGDVVIVIDAGFGAFTRAGEPLRAARFDAPAALSEVPDPTPPASPRVLLWHAARGPQVAGVLDVEREVANGAFTWHVLGALYGWADGALGTKDGQVSVEEAQTWVARRFEAMGWPQQPSVDLRPEVRARTLAPARRAAPNLDNVEPAPSPAPKASTGGLGSVVVSATPRTLEAIERLGAEGATKVIPHTDGKLLQVTLPPDQLAELLRPGQREAVRALTPEALAADQSLLAEEVRRQAQTRADADWKAVHDALRSGQPEALERLARFVDRWSAVQYPVGGIELRFTAAQVPEARRLLEEGATAVASTPTVRVPAGSFTLGSPLGTPGRGPDETPHRVTLTRPVLFERALVTHAAFSALLGRGPAGGTEGPVAGVSWLDAVAYCNARSAEEGLAPAYQIEGRTVRPVPRSPGWRLPTEAEWAHAVQAGLVSPHPTVAEWVFDAYTPFTGESVTDPAPHPGRLRVVKGGANAEAVRASARKAVAADTAAAGVGFRVVRSE